ESCDPFVTALIFMAMEHAAELRVHGRVSPLLLENLTEFQAAWASWRPERYRTVDIFADCEREESPPASNRPAICAFTGGVDSSFTVYRHTKKLCGRARKDIQAALFVHGFDISLDQPDAFARAAGRARHALSDLAVELLTVKTNHKELNPDWNYTHGVGIASCLALFSRRYSCGLIGSTYNYRRLSSSWGSNPVTDRLLSSGSFQIVHDGAGYTRSQKLDTVAAWREGFRNLRVCWSAPRQDENCGRCGKCVLTLVALMIGGLPQPESFAGASPTEALRQLRNLDAEHTEMFEYARDRARRGGLDRRLMWELERCAWYNRTRLRLERSSGNRLIEAARRLALKLHACLA
ncbi:MAG TPA: hypothetical protein V6D08_10190, partial [Candidatus Obscuribacterales bacterium]